MKDVINRRIIKIQFSNCHWVAKKHKEARWRIKRRKRGLSEGSLKRAEGKERQKMILPEVADTLHENSRGR